MFPSKADRILSRYRPIAPKPLPLPPSGSSLATDPSSTCASPDSFTSSCKGRRARNKRRAAPANLPTGKCPKLPKLNKAQALPAISNTAGASASSVTEGNSDGIVPRCNSRSLGHISPWTFGSLPFSDSRVSMSMPNGISQPVVPSQRTTISRPTPLAMADGIIEAARSYMVADAPKTWQKPSQPQASLHSGNPVFCNGVSMDNDVALMEGACVKSPGQGAGGGFNEMIRGITRLPTMADVQSLMQTKSASAMTLAPELVGSCVGQEMSSCVPEVQQHLPQLYVPLLHPPLSRPLVKIWEPTVHEGGLAMSALPRNVDGTLPLLPSVPSKISASEPSQVETLCLFQAEDPSEWPCKSGEDYPSSAVTGQIGMLRCMDKAVYGVGKAANGVGHGLHSLAPWSPMKSVCGVASSSSPLICDSTIIDYVYLEQTYGSSTDPVLLLDQNNQALWSNKAYDRALKVASERLSYKLASTGPYFDPLGHPTRLGSFVLNVPSEPANAFLWGFLKKLVMPEAEVAPSATSLLTIDTSIKDRTCDSQAFGSRSSNDDVGGPLASSGWPDCTRNGCLGWLTMVTLENVTEVHMGEDAAILEPLEVVEAKLGALGSVPVFITDCTSRVRWMNSAFEHMLGSSKSSKSTIEEEIKRTALYEPPQLTVVGSTEKLPRAAWAFCGLVNLEWMKLGKRRTMTVPCDVSRMATASVWVWKFDLELSLSLNV